MNSNLSQCRALDIRHMQRPESFCAPSVPEELEGRTDGVINQSTNPLPLPSSTHYLSASPGCICGKQDLEEGMEGRGRLAGLADGRPIVDQSRPQTRSLTLLLRESVAV